MNTANLDPTLIQALEWRCIGPPRGGRAPAVAGHPTEDMVFYFGACGGGVWKTNDGGTYWENISDGYFTAAAVGALALSESDPNVLYAGTGETNIRLDVTYGDGVYKSTDGGSSWSHVGLKETRHIGEIRIHPQDPDLVYVAALGHVFGPNPERGVFRSRDGGNTWDKVLYRSEKAGAVDLSMDPRNPRVLYAAIWEAYRNFWTLSSGGPGSGIFRTRDGGDTWEELSDRPGLPTGLKGKIGIAASPARSGRVWAIIEAEEGGLFRSDDGGDTWELMSDHRELYQRPFYYCHVFADPCDAETVYITNLKMWKSTDGGRTFTEITTPHGDNHDLWIDPHNPKRMIEGNDGGACVTFNGGSTWSTIYNQLTSQFYRITTDGRFPYQVYATQQDNSSITVPSATEYGAIPWNHCYPVGTGESGDIAVHPEDPDIAYIGAIGSSPGGNGVLQRYDHRSRQIRLVNVWPEDNFGWAPKDLKYRFSWTFPIAFSPHDSRVLYAAGNHIFRSTDEGNSWEAISPDLSRNDPNTLGLSGGPITHDNTGAEGYGTVYAFAESPHEAGVFWAGSDDGLIHISRNGAQTWEDITPPELPEFTLISKIALSPHAPGSAWVAATRVKLDDYGPYLFTTEDYGRSWKNISGAFPADEITRVVCEDPVRPGLLYVGTESGIYISLDHGASWQRLQTNLPVVPVYDLVVKDEDLVAGTHGRSFWILDDLSPLRQLQQEKIRGPQLFAPRPSYRRWLNWSNNLFHGPGKNYMLGLGANAAFYQEESPDGEPGRRFLDAGQNPPQGVIIYYALDAEPAAPIQLEFLDAEGNHIKTFASKTEADVGSDDENEDESAETEDRFAPAAAGLNRFVWDMRYPEAPKVIPDKTRKKPIDGPRPLPSKAKNGPVAAPGHYQVRLKVGAAEWTQPFEIRPDPRVQATREDLDAQFELWQRIHAKLGQTNETVNQIRRLRFQARDWARRTGQTHAEIAAAAKDLAEKLLAIESELIQTKEHSPADRIRLPARLNAKLSGLTSVVGIADAAPTQQSYAVFEHLAAQVDEQRDLLEALREKELADLNRQIARAALPPLAT